MSDFGALPPVEQIRRARPTAPSLDGPTSVSHYALARAANLRAGASTRLSVRPERVHLNPTSAMETQVTATVVDVIYLGRYARVRLKTCGLEEFIVTLPNDGRDLVLASGTQLALGWNVSDCRALDGE